MSSIRVLKFALHETGETVLPTEVQRVLGVGWQGPQLVAWVEALELEPGVLGRGTTHLVTIGTGSDVPSGYGRYAHVGSAAQATSTGNYVLHVYRVWP